MKKFLVFTLIVLLLFAFTSCFQASQTQAPSTTVVDANGNSVLVPQKPQKVAVLFSSFADIWLAAGGEIAITVGETVERKITNDQIILVDGGAGKHIDTELLISSDPDFVICSADIEAQLEAAQICNNAGIPAVALRVESFSDYMHLMSIFTNITERPDRYEEFALNVDRDIRNQLQNFQEKNASVLFIRAGSGARSTKAKTAREHFACQMLDELGTVNIASKAPILLDGLSFEEILMQDPDFIFVTTMGDEAAAKSYMESVFSDRQWQELSAVKNNKVFYLPKELFQYKPNMRWAEAYAYLIDILNS